MLPPARINSRYVQVPAKVVIEIDVRDQTEGNYVNRKTRRLLDFGTGKVIWIFTDSQQVLVAERGAAA